MVHATVHNVGNIVRVRMRSAHPVTSCSTSKLVSRFVCSFVHKAAVRLPRERAKERIAYTRTASMDNLDLRILRSTCRSNFG